LKDLYTNGGSAIWNWPIIILVISFSNRTGSPKQPTMPTAEEADHHRTMVDVEVNEDSSSSSANEGSSSKASNNSHNQDQEPQKIKADPTAAACNRAP
jgi:hypothetical protein